LRQENGDRPLGDVGPVDLTVARGCGLQLGNTDLVRSPDRLVVVGRQRDALRAILLRDDDQRDGAVGVGFGQLDQGRPIGTRERQRDSDAAALEPQAEALALGDAHFVSVLLTCGQRPRYRRARLQQNRGDKRLFCDDGRRQGCRQEQTTSQQGSHAGQSRAGQTDDV
jgi:hypothetical protein